MLHSERMTPIRVVLWTQAAVVCYTGAVVHLDRLGILDFWTINELGLQDYTTVGKIVWGLVGLLGLGLYAFPILFFIVVSFRPQKSAVSIVVAFLAEILLEFGHFIALLPAIS